MKVNPRTIRAQGDRARDRAQRRAGGPGKRIAAADWRPEIEYFDGLGWNNRQVAEALQLTERRISQIRNTQATAAANAARAPAEAPLSFDEMDAKYQAMLPLTADAYELFFNEFSGHTLTPEHKLWVQAFLDHRRLMLNVPPRHGKSVTFSTWVPIWLIARNRNEQILLISKTHNLAIQFCNEIGHQLENNQHLVEVFGRFAPERRGDLTWRPSRGQFIVLGRDTKAKAGQLTLQARGAGQHILGMEATVAIFDDIADVAVATHDIQREAQVDWFRGEALSRIEGFQEGSASGRAIVLGQRVHPLDIYGEIKDQVFERGPNKGEPFWTVITRQAVLDWEKELVMWPEYRPWEELMLTYESVGYAKFMTMYQQEPSAAGIGLTSPEWWDRCRDYNRGVGESVPVTERFLPMVTVMGVDTSAVEWNAIVVGDLVWNREQFGFLLRHTERFKGDTGELCRRLEANIHEFHPTYTVMERWAYTQGFENLPEYQVLKTKSIFLPHSTTSHTKQHEELGLSSIAPDVEQGRIRLPAKDDAAREMTRNLEDEANQWPNARTSDQLMALWFIKYNYRKLMPREGLTGGFNGAPGQTWGYMTRQPGKEPERAWTN